MTLIVDVECLLIMYFATRNVYYLEELLIQLLAICTLCCLKKGPLKELFDGFENMKADAKLSKWDPYNRPSIGQYLQNKSLFDNPDYFNQTTGEPNWTNFAKSATKNPNSNLLVLAKYNNDPNEVSYERVAQDLKAKYF